MPSYYVNPKLVGYDETTSSFPVVMLRKQKTRFAQTLNYGQLLSSYMIPYSFNPLVVATLESTTAEMEGGKVKVKCWWIMIIPITRSLTRGYIMIFLCNDPPCVEMLFFLLLHVIHHPLHFLFFQLKVINWSYHCTVLWLLRFANIVTMTLFMGTRLIVCYYIHMLLPVFDFVA